MSGGTGKDRIAELERALTALREDSEVAYVLLGLSGALAEVRSIDQTLHLVTRTVPHLFGADRCVIVREGSDGREVGGQSGYSDAEASAIAQELLSDPASSLARALDTLEVSLSSTGDGSDGASLSIPLVRWGEVFGAIYLGFERAREFGPRDETLARGVARQVGAALNNSRRFKLLKDLGSFGAEVGTNLRTPNVIRSSLEAATEMFGAVGAWFYLFDQSQRVLVTTGANREGIALPERLARIDLNSEPWVGLLRAPTLTIPDIGKHFSRSDLTGIAACIPRAGGGLMGMLLVVLADTHQAADDEIEALNVLAGQTGQALETARRFERERSVARSLQSALLQTEAVAGEGCDIGAIYETADNEADVGGDFYDVIELPDGAFGLVVGDVSGKGAEAAAQTAMVKYMLRAFAMRNPSPGSVLFHLNNALVKGMQEDRFTTVLYAMFSADGRQVTIASAGHPNPLIYRASTGEVRVVEPPGMVAGCFEDQSFDAVSETLEPGDIFVVFTDGLTEAKAGDDLYGEERVARSLGRNAHFESADDVARALYTEARNFGRVTDDTVVLTLKLKGA